MSVHIKTGDAWKTCKSVHVNVSGTWHTCKQVYVNVSGTWKPCILVSGSKTVTGPSTDGGSVTISNVKKGSTVKITGTINNYCHWYSAGCKFTITNGSISDTGYIRAAEPDPEGASSTTASISKTYTINSTSSKITCHLTNKNCCTLSDVKITYTEEYYP